MSATITRPSTMRALRALVVATIVLLLIQGWLGDSVTIFISPANGITPSSPTPGDIVGELQKLPTSFIPLWHAFQGLALTALAVVVLIASFMWSRSRGVRIWAVVGLVCVLSSALGGYEFVRSGFADGGSSAQMGSAYIAALASYFLVLYYTK